MSPAARKSSLFATPPPAAAVECAADRVTVVSLERGAPPVVAAHATEPLPDGVIAPALNAPNIQDVNAAADALRRAVDRTRVRGRVALVVPDAVARVSIIPFDQVPAEKDLDELIRWQVRKSVPFRIEDAQVAYWPGAARTGDSGEAGREFIVSVARRDVIEQYESICARAGLQAGIVDIASFNVINAVVAEGAPDGDWLLVHVAGSEATLAIVRGEDLIFFRNPSISGDETIEDMTHQTAMYYEDRLGGGRFSRVIVAGLSGPSAADARRRIEARIGTAVETLDTRGAAGLRDRIAAGNDVLEAIAAPVGILLREST